MTEKTEDLPGVTGRGVSVPKIDEVENAVLEWRTAVEKRMKLTEQEIETKKNVIDLMHKHEITSYPYGDDKRVVLSVGKENVKLKSFDEDEEEE